MSLFDRLVDEALRNVEELAPLRVVVQQPGVEREGAKHLARR